MTTSMTPLKDKYFRLLDKFMEDNGYENRILTRGVTEEDTEEEEEEVPPIQYDYLLLVYYIYQFLFRMTKAEILLRIKLTINCVLF